EFETRVIVDLDLNSERLRARLDDSNRLRMTIVGDKKSFLVAGVTAPGYSGMTKRHRLGGGRGFIEQRRISDVERSQIHDHLLEIEQRLESALSDFGLVRRVSSVPARIFENVSLDNWRRDAVV